MNETLFRKSSLERVSSPEQLNEYIRVTSPGVWLLLLAVVLLLAGAICWGVLGTVESAVETSALVMGGQGVCCVSQSEAIEAGMALTAGGVETTVSAVTPLVAGQGGEMENYLRSLAGRPSGEPCSVVLFTAAGLPDGTYGVRIVTESLHPIQFVTH